ncbi:hypothetical protein D3C83_43270 [compost metagenome]
MSLTGVSREKVSEMGSFEAGLSCGGWALVMADCARFLISSMETFSDAARLMVLISSIAFTISTAAN